MIKLTILIASLALASAGYIRTEPSYAAPVATPTHHSPAPAVSYSSFVRHFPSQPALHFTHDQTHPVTVVSAPNHEYAAPLTNQQRFIYAQNQAPALAYGQGYAPALPQDHYRYPEYDAPLLATKPLVVAQPQPHLYHHHNTYATHAAPVVAAQDYHQGEGLVYDQHHGHY
ncbi:cuticle protein-like [Aedes albopictus]|uniref:Cuticle protein n=1 Tax=Aedes albopictus TaxID=7160 RepID=A0ABM1YB85_AEDAL